MTCSECLHFRPRSAPQNSGDCFRFPPQGIAAFLPSVLAGGAGRVEVQFMVPVVEDARPKCGEFVSKATKNTGGAAKDARLVHQQQLCE